MAGKGDKIMMKMVDNWNRTRGSLRSGGVTQIFEFSANTACSIQAAVASGRWGRWESQSLQWGDLDDKFLEEIQ